jgi:trk system potassium uptake protein
MESAARQHLEQPDRRPPVPLGMLLAAFLLMMVLAFVVLRQGFATTRGAGINVDHTLFMVVNASTLTGFQLSVTPSDYKWPGQLIMLVLTIGGSLFTMIAGSTAVVRIVRLPYSFRQVVAAALMLELLAMGLGMALLLRPEGGLLPAVTLAASAIGNSGIHIGGVPGLMDWRTHLVLLPLSIIGGLGLAVVMNLTDWLRGRMPLITHSRAAIALSAGCYLAGTGLILVLEWMAADLGVRSVAVASAASLNSRTLGMPVAWLASFTRSAQWIILILMVIGASPGGTGGGLKTTTLAALFTGAGRSLRGEPVGLAMGVAVVWLVLYLGIVLSALLVLLHTQAELEADRLLFLCVSAVSNVGLSHDAVGLVGGGLYTLSAAMLAGRLAPLMILWWMAEITSREEVAVG